MEKFMLEALKQAEKAYKANEVPVGCVIVKDDKIIAKAFNKRNTSKMACAHAEILAINKACKKLKDWRLSGCSLFVTLEPCPMCAGACFNARIDNVIFGATDEKSGAFTSKVKMQNKNLLNHTLNVTGEVLKEPCEKLISDFFKAKRK